MAAILNTKLGLSPFYHPLGHLGRGRDLHLALAPLSAFERGILFHSYPHVSLSYGQNH